MYVIFLICEWYNFVSLTLTILLNVCDHDYNISEQTLIVTDPYSVVLVDTVENVK